MLSKLKSKRFNCVSRAIDMLCLFLGEDYSFVSEQGKKIEVAEYSLHFQTTWRFRKNEKILLASRDIYEPYNANVPVDWEYDLIGRSDDLSSIFDVRVKEFNLKMQNAVVTKCYFSVAKDIIIEISNGVVFEQFVSASKKGEEWRLIDYTDDIQTVFYDEKGNIYHIKN